MQSSDIQNEDGLRRPLSITLLGGLYFFFFLLTVSSYSQPIPFMGTIYQELPVQVIVFADSLLCLYLFLKLMKHQQLTWYLLLSYNAFETANTLTNLFFITPAELEKIVGEKVDPSGLVSSNLSVIIAIIILSVFIFRQRSYFTNHSKYLF